MTDDFRELLIALRAEDVRFLVVGAHALAAHGVPRVTGDLDVWVEPTAMNATRTWRALVDFGAPLAALGVSEKDFTTPNQVIQLGIPPFRIDILTSISGVEFTSAWQESVQGTLFDVPVQFIGREAFIRNKRASGRTKDLDDIRALEGE
ncbi:hypothetical protein [Gemmatimonas sp. UBA7669]|uniref:hypothetical protein n=1 Tax=Gemmatimonas sp. UBA7669 TaxID=1946568 RepID=UPI0025C20FDF|nr:hypothetical protein [Gemmatimonas sp. UBA7669]MBL0891733.1 hypothetical protein [Gemmatimonadaceae bacterium]